MSSETEYSKFTHPPTKPFPPTGSLFYREGVFYGRSMTLKEQRFEKFVNDMQARQDLISEFKEWRRLKDLEEEAIVLYHELGQDQEEFKSQMMTRDQMDMEFQLQRKRKKAENLDPEMARSFLFMMFLDRQQNLRAEQAEQRERDEKERRAREESIKCKKKADFHAGVQASSVLMVKTDIIANAAGLQQRSQQTELTRAKPEKDNNSSRPVTPTGIRLTRDAPKEHINISRPVSDTKASSSKQQEQESKPSPEEIRRQFKAEVDVKSVISQANTSVDSGSSRQQEQESKLSRQFQEEVRLRPVATTTLNVRSVTPKTAAHEQEMRAKVLDPAVPAVRKDPFQSLDTVLAEYHPQGLMTSHPGHPSAIEQSPPANVGQWLDSNTLCEDPVPGSSTQPSTDPSSQYSSSKGDTPPSSVRSSPPKSPIQNPLSATDTQMVNTNQHKKKCTKRICELLGLTGCGKAPETSRSEMMEASSRDVLAVNDILLKEFERKEKARLAMEEEKRQETLPSRYEMLLQALEESSEKARSAMAEKKRQGALPSHYEMWQQTMEENKHRSALRIEYERLQREQRGCSKVGGHTIWNCDCPRKWGY